MSLAELAALDPALAERLLARARRHTRNPRDTIERLARGEALALPAHSPLTAAARALAEARRGGAASLEAVRRLCLSVAERSTVFERCDADAAVLALGGLARERAAWVRAPEEWRPRTRSPERQLRDLARHLLARYEVPRFLERVWTEGDGVHQRWYVHLGAGRSLRAAPGLPFPLSRRAAHEILRAPAELTPRQALRWGQVRALGGADAQARAVAGTRLVADVAHEAFWSVVLRFLLAHPELAPLEYGPIVDYLHHQKFVVPHGAHGPPQPHLAMKGREPGALRRQVQRWHRSLRVQGPPRSWSPHPRGRPLACTLWMSASGAPASEVRLELVELLSSAALADEGRALVHCVATYAGSCARGRCSIWSVRARRGAGPWERLATVELAPNGLIVQARARANQVPSPLAWEAIRRWCAENGFKVSPLVPR